MKIKLLTIILFSITLHSFGQKLNSLDDKQDKIKSIKVAFLTNELNLTPEESAKFWPLFNAYYLKQRRIKISNIKAYLNMKDDSGEEKVLSDKEASLILNQIDNNDEELYQAKKKFNSSLLLVLPTVKILKLRKAEEKFNKKLLEQFRNKKKND
jgi:hypothetical protein